MARRTRLFNAVRFIAASLAALVVCFSMPAANAQEALGIAAIVNDDIVSVFDLESRLSLAIASSRLPNTPATRQQLSGQVLRGLIDETLKHQEAKRLGIQVTKSDVDRALASVAEQNKIPLSRLDAFLAAQGIHKPTLIEKMEADVVWIKVANRSLRSSIEIDNKAVERFIETLEAEKGKIENNVSEVFLPVDDASQEAQVLETAEQMIEQVRSGASFNALAQTFSQSATAAVTGNLGWLKQGDLDDVLQAAVNALQPGQTSDPIRSVSGYHLFHLIARQRAQGLPVSEVTVDLQQLVFALPPSASEAEVQSQTDLAKTMAGSITSCEDMEHLGKELGSDLSGSLKGVKVNALAPALREIVEPLGPQKIGTPVRTAGGIILLMVCERHGGDLSAEQRNAIRDLLINRRVDESARRYLRDIRRSAFVDIRL